MEEKVRKALQGTSNRSAPGPDGISYLFIKIMFDMRLGKGIIREVAELFKEGQVPEEW